MILLLVRRSVPTIYIPSPGQKRTGGGGEKERMKEKLIALGIISMFLLVGTISAFNFEEKVYGLESEEVAVTFDNNTGRVNVSNYWDNLDTPASISLDDLGDTTVSAPSQYAIINWDGVNAWIDTVLSTASSYLSWSGLQINFDE